MQMWIRKLCSRCLPELAKKGELGLSITRSPATAVLLHHCPEKKCRMYLITEEIAIYLDWTWKRRCDDLLVHRSLSAALATVTLLLGMGRRFPRSLPDRLGLFPRLLCLGLHGSFLCPGLHICAPVLDHNLHKNRYLSA
jgi:hypothetical protein